MAQISPALDARPALQSAGRLVHEAVHRNRPLSREGLSERLFTLAFGGLVYPQIWEDPAVDLAAMEITPDHHVVTIASGGCNVMSYLTASPARITAVDLNRSHVALTRLKLAGHPPPPELGCILPLLRRGRRGLEHRAPSATISRRISIPRPAIYWEGSGAVGRRRIALFSAQSLPPRPARPLHRRRPPRWPGFMASTSPTSSRRATPRASSAVLRQQACAAVRQAAGALADTPPASLFGLGIPPAQYARSRRPARATSPRCCAPRLERLACGFPLRDNYFAWQAFDRALCRQAAAARCRPISSRSTIRRIRERPRRVEVQRIVHHRGPLAAMAPDSVDRLCPARRAGLDDRRPAQRPMERDHPHRPARRPRHLPHRCRTPRSCRAGSHAACSIAGAMRTSARAS